jgi:hypothetical protein
MIEPPTRLLRDSLKWKKLPNRRNNAMAEGINRYFMADTRAFVDANYLTTAGIFHPPEGTMAFDLHRQEGITPSVVTIEPTNTAKNDESIRVTYRSLQPIAPMSLHQTSPAARSLSIRSATACTASIT